MQGRGSFGFIWHKLEGKVCVFQNVSKQDFNRFHIFHEIFPWSAGCVDYPRLGVFSVNLMGSGKTACHCYILINYKYMHILVCAFKCLSIDASDGYNTRTFYAMFYWTAWFPCGLAAWGTKYTDDSFNPLENEKEVLYVDKEGPGYNKKPGKVLPPPKCGWQRATEIFRNPQMFTKGESKEQSCFHLFFPMAEHSSLINQPLLSYMILYEYCRDGWLT